VREVSLICGACLAISTDLFKRLGGFDAENVPISHSDVDLCLRARELGYNCVYTPHAELTHIGHASIGREENKSNRGSRSKVDIFLMRRFGKYLQNDPYFPSTMRDILYIDSQEEFRYFSGHRERSMSGGDAILVSHDLSSSGGPKIVYDMARSLLASGWFVLVISPQDGGMRQSLLEIGSDVIIEPLALRPHDTVIDCASNFDTVILNTIVCWPLARALGSLTSVYWYVHESDLAEHYADANPGFVETFRHVAGVWTGSRRSAAALRRIGVEAITLEYGVERWPECDRKVPDAEIVISVLGTFERRKGQDLAVLGFRALLLIASGVVAGYSLQVEQTTIDFLNR